MAMRRHTADIRTVDVVTPVRVVLPDGIEIHLHRSQRMEMEVEESEGQGNWSVTLTQLQPAYEETAKALTGKMEQNPRGYDYSAKVMAVARDRATLVKKLEDYVAVLKSGPCTGNLQQASSDWHLNASYSEDRSSPVALLVAPARSTAGSRWPESWGEELGA